jgi:hypothetical protein
MSTDFESAFYRIVADNFSPDDNLPAFPPTSHFNREWFMHERVSDDVPVTDRSRARAQSTALVVRDPAQGWVDPSNGHLYLPGESIAPPATNEHNATYNHPGNVNPFRDYPQPFNPDDLPDDLRDVWDS